MEIEERSYVESILKVFEIPEEIVDEVLKCPLIRTAESVEEFREKLGDYVEGFGHLFKYGKRPYGRGELLPFLSIKGARIGSSKEKDITVNGKVLEVKELDSGKYFDTASEGSISNTRFLQNIQTFYRYLGKINRGGEYDIRINYFNNQFSKGGMSNGELCKLEELIKSIQTEGPVYSYIKVGSERYTMSPNIEYTVKFDEKGSITTTLPLADDYSIYKSKLQQHPWVVSAGEEFKRDLEEIKQHYLTGIDFLLLYIKQTPILITKEEAKTRILPYRIALGNLHLEFR
jgi:hypothetical protein